MLLILILLDLADMSSVLSLPCSLYHDNLWILCPGCKVNCSFCFSQDRVTGMGFIYLLVLICLYCCNKIPQTECFKHQKFISSKFWRPEVQDQGTSKFGFWWGMSFWLASCCFLSVSSCDVSVVLLWGGERERERALWCFFL